MGGNKSMQSDSKLSKFPVPRVYYINRFENFLLLINEKKTEKLKFNSDIELCKDSAIGEISANKIMVAGGCDKNSTLQNDVYTIDTKAITIEPISFLPKLSKFGQLFPYKHYIYYVCGITYNKNNPDQYISNPIMRYNTQESRWEVFKHKKRPISGVKNLKNDGKLINDFNNPFDFTKLFTPGAFILNTKIYFYGGTALSNVPEPNHLVFSIDLETEALDLALEPYYFAYSINMPLSASNSKMVFITGGQTFNSVPSTSCYMFTTKKGFFGIESEKIENVENYPPKCTEDYICIPAFPKMLVKYKDSEHWITFNLLQKNFKFHKKTFSSYNKFINKPPLYKSGNLGIDWGDKSLKPGAKAYTSRFFGVHNDKKPHVNRSGSGEFLRFPNNFNVKQSFDFAIVEEAKDNFLSSQLIELVSEENDEDVLIPHKKALKIFKSAAEVLGLQKITALDLNQISIQLDFKLEVNLFEISLILKEILEKKKYAYVCISNFIQTVHKLLERPRLRSGVLKQIFELLQIPRKFIALNNSETILIITRVIKITFTGFVF
jgi:hypothetical protein